VWPLTSRGNDLLGGGGGCSRDLAKIGTVHTRRVGIPGWQHACATCCTVHLQWLCPVWLHCSLPCFLSTCTVNPYCLLPYLAISRTALLTTLSTQDLAKEKESAERAIARLATGELTTRSLYSIMEAWGCDMGEYHQGLRLEGISSEV
jgi:hypothetical protein